jgi:hypothetical protein
VADTTLWQCSHVGTASKTVNALLERLDRGIAWYYEDGDTTDEINPP